MMTITLFDGNLSSLHELCLQSVRTELPWRNMVNLTSFTLGYTLPGSFPTNHLLDFSESAPRLRKIQLHYATPTSGVQHGRLVSLGCLKRMDILGGGPSSLLLDHLLIPVGAKLTTRVEVDLSDPRHGPWGSTAAGHLPRSFDNLRNLSNFTKVHLHLEESRPRIQFGGPNGRVTMLPAPLQADTTHRVYASLSQLDTSKVERLTIAGGDLSDGFGNCTFWQVFRRMRSLHILTISPPHSSTSWTIMKNAPSWRNSDSTPASMEKNSTS